MGTFGEADGSAALGEGRASGDQQAVDGALAQHELVPGLVGGLVVANRVLQSLLGGVLQATIIDHALHLIRVLGGQIDEHIEAAIVLGRELRISALEQPTNRRLLSQRGASDATRHSHEDAREDPRRTGGYSLMREEEAATLGRHGKRWRTAGYSRGDFATCSKLQSSQRTAGY